jgi:hypothetical protein
MSGSWLPAAARPICTGCAPGARPRVAIVATSVRVSGRSLSLKLRFRRFGCRSGAEAVDRNYIGVFPLFVRPIQREIKARAAAYRLWKPRATAHEAVPELRDNVLRRSTLPRGPRRPWQGVCLQILCAGKMRVNLEKNSHCVLIDADEKERRSLSETSLRLPRPGATLASRRHSVIRLSISKGNEPVALAHSNSTATSVRSPRQSSSWLPRASARGTHS